VSDSSYPLLAFLGEVAEVTRLVTTPRKEPRQARSQATVEAILTATARVLVKYGYDHASTNRVAGAAGVSVGSLYQYFPTKEALVAALIDRHMSEMTALLEMNIDVVREAPLPLATRALVKLMLVAHAQNPKLHKIFAEQCPRVGRMSRFYEIERQIGERIRSYLEGHESELRIKNLDISLFIVVSVVEALTHMTVVDHPGRFDEEELLDEITSLVVRYVMKNPPP
jgi:AcrR family transcriptional regulator